MAKVRSACHSHPRGLVCKKVMPLTRGCMADPHLPMLQLLLNLSLPSPHFIKPHNPLFLSPNSLLHHTLHFISSYSAILISFFLPQNTPFSISTHIITKTTNMCSSKAKVTVGIEGVAAAAAAATTQGAKTSGGVSSSSSSSSKKGRGGSVQSAQPPRCQVQGCNADLSGAKAYYSRHKVCAMHSKSPTVIVAGLEQRFCQQCSRLPSFSLSLSLFFFIIHLIKEIFLFFLIL